MKITTWSQDLSDRRQWSGRGRLNLWRNDECVASIGAEVVCPRRPRAEASVRLHFGNRYSETPIDAHLAFLGAGIYLNTSLGRRAADWITRGRSRDLRLAVRNGELWWNLWTSPDHDHSKHVRRGGKYRSWTCRDGCFSLDPMEWAWGPKRYFYEDVDTVHRDVVIDGDTYPVTLTLQRASRGRVKSTRRRHQYLSCDWSAERGIPTHFDKSYGWKGTGTYGSSFHLPEWAADSTRWGEVAAAQLAAWVISERAQTGWTREHEEKVKRRRTKP